MIPAWVAFSVAAPAVQTVRFMLQKHLKATELTTMGATFARFFYSAPLIALAVLLYAQGSGAGLPEVTPGFWAYALAGGMGQIFATMCVVALFAHRNFAVGITFKKTEVIQTALLGWIVLGEALPLWGILAIMLGFVGVLLLADTKGTGVWHRRLLTPATGLGLASGAFFALAGVGYRGATLAVVSDDVLMRAGVALALVTIGQVAAMALWMAWREAGQITAVARAWRVAGLVGITSMLGSFCWFAAFAQQTTAYVYAVGQVELVFSIAASALFFREQITTREVAGMALLVVSVVALVALG